LKLIFNRLIIYSRKNPPPCGKFQWPAGAGAEQEPTISWGLPEALALRVSQSLGTFWQRFREVGEQ